MIGYRTQACLKAWRVRKLTNGDVSGLMLAAVTAIVLLAGCAPRGAITLDPGAAEIGRVHTIFVASSRMPHSNGHEYLNLPGKSLRFSRVAVSVPPDRQLGTVTFPVTIPPDPTRDFLTVSSDLVADRNAFVRAINGALQQQPPNRREIFVFVHGFNTNFAEGLYRQAQMHHDFGAPGIAMHYSWPSAARPRFYATDRETVLLARDELEELIDLLSRSNATGVVVAGHSMGAMIVTETLRQMGIRDVPGSFRKIETVVLMAPDVDVNVFRQQTAALRGKDVAFYVFTSTRDRALRLSAAARGYRPRLGALTDAKTLPDLPVTIIDLSNVTGNSNALNHFKVATSPVMISILQGMSSYGLRLFSDATNDPVLLETGLELVRDLTNIPPLTTKVQ